MSAIDDPTTLGQLISEFRSAKEHGISCDRLRSFGIASPLAMMADLGARGYKLELTGGGQPSAARVGTAPWSGGVEASADAAVRATEAGRV